MKIAYELNHRAMSKYDKGILTGDEISRWAIGRAMADINLKERVEKQADQGYFAYILDPGDLTMMHELFMAWMPKAYETFQIQGPWPEDGYSCEYSTFLSLLIDDLWTMGFTYSTDATAIGEEDGSLLIEW